MKNDKLISLEELQKIVSNLKTEGKKVVYCHGVFDVLHIGHIRHLEQAKKYGETLIVTITPDEYVNKGPHRPVFNQNIRMEALASLEIVDYVALNKWPTAVNTLKFLKPTFYVKGIEYSNVENDYSRGIVAEEDAIKEVGGQLKFTDDLVFSSSALINRYMNVFTKEAENFLIELSKKYSQKEIIDYLEQIKKLKILIIGEAIIDEYCYGKAIGKAGKEPMLALKYLKTEKFAGGTLAIANHLSDFCEDVTLFTLLGEVDAQKDFIESNLNKKIKRFFYYKKDSPTIVKRRFIEEIPDLRKLLEFYEFNDTDLDYAQTKELSADLERILPDYDVVIIADFGHGMLNEELINLIIKKSKFLAINTQVNAGNMGYNIISKYPKVNYICLDERELRLECLDKKSELKELLPKVAKKVFCDKILVTRGSQGCIFFSSNNIKKIPAFSDHVVDTMGAGDAFLSITSPLVALNVPMEVIGFIGNAIGALKVKTIGNKEPIGKVALYKYIKSLMSW